LIFKKVANLNFTNSVAFTTHLTLTPEFNFFLFLVSGYRQRHPWCLKIGVFRSSHSTRQHKVWGRENKLLNLASDQPSLFMSDMNGKKEWALLEEQVEKLSLI
jgi:hypothetical protein